MENRLLLHSTACNKVHGSSGHRDEWCSFTIRSFLILTCLILAMTSCTEKATGEKNVKPGITLHDSTSAMSRYGLEEAAPHIVELPGELSEISGIAFTADQRLFGHDDEKGNIYQINAEDGMILKMFELGGNGRRNDFEDIAIVDEQFFLVTSNGDLYSFLEGANGETVPHARTETELRTRHDVEGLCYDPHQNSLLLACKEYAGKGKALKNVRAVYEYELESGTLSPDIRFRIDLEQLKRNGIDQFKPSGIARHPERGTYFIVSSREPSIIELTPEGSLAAHTLLPKKIHQQPEGIAFGDDGTLYISNEGQPGTIVIYPQQ